MSEQDPSNQQSITSNPWWLFSAGFIVLVLAGLGFVLLTDPPTNTPAPAPGPTAEAPSSPEPRGTSSRPTSSADCVVGAGDLTVPRSAPQGVEWRLDTGIAFPVSPAGPGRNSGEIRSCFAHSPTGALLSAATYALSTQLSNREKLVQERLTDGPEKTAALNAAKSLPPDTEVANRGQVAAFRFISYTPANSTVAVVLKKEATNYVVVTYTMVWTGTDWLIDGNPVGGLTPAQPVSDVSGYVTWAGV